MANDEVHYNFILTLITSKNRATSDQCIFHHHFRWFYYVNGILDDQDDHSIKQPDGHRLALSPGKKTFIRHYNLPDVQEFISVRVLYIDHNFHYSPVLLLSSPLSSPFSFPVISFSSSLSDISMMVFQTWL